jgi:glycosyltransferase involved in cell wall biosynthesis
LDEALRDFDPDVVVVAGLWLHSHLDRLREHGRQVIIDAADIEGSLYQDLADVPSRGERMVRTVLARRVAEIERCAVACVDQVWACSEHDARVMQARYPAAALVAVVPNTVDVESLRRPASPTPSAPTVVYTASFGYAPNQGAALSLITEIHPLVRGRFPSATLSLVGTGPTAAMRTAAAAAHDVTVTGPVPDTRPWLWGSTALAAPLHVGSGTRIKFLEAFAAGLPVVSTPKGAEGLDVVDGEHLLIARSPRQFADAIVDLHADPSVSAALAARARELVEHRYSTASARQAIESALGRMPARTR